VPGHYVHSQRLEGRTSPSAEETTERYRQIIARMRSFIDKRLSAAVYTQTSDTEREYGGFVTYDRAIKKFPVDEICALNRMLYEPPPVVRTALCSMEQANHTPGASTFWRYTTDGSR
jgi:hypothetical protein